MYSCYGALKHGLIKWIKLLINLSNHLFCARRNYVMHSYLIGFCVCSLCVSTSTKTICFAIFMRTIRKHQPFKKQFQLIFQLRNRFSEFSSISLSSKNACEPSVCKTISQSNSDWITYDHSVQFHHNPRLPSHRINLEHKLVKKKKHQMHRRWARSHADRQTKWFAQLEKHKFQ